MSSVKFDIATVDGLADWNDRWEKLVDGVRSLYSDVLERVLNEIGREHVAYIRSLTFPPGAYGRPATTQIVGHAEEILAEVWIEWSGPDSCSSIVTVKGRYSPGTKR